MDAQTRHQLKQNELAEALTRLRGVRFDSRMRLVLVGLAVVIVAIIAFRAWRSSAQRKLESQWGQISFTTLTAQGDEDGSNAEKLRGVISSTSDNALKACARVRLAAALRTQALNTPERRQELLNEAAGALKDVTSSNAAALPMRGAAMLSLAGVDEALNQFNEARELYTTLSTDPKFDGYPVRDVAADKLKTLDRVAKPVELVAGEAPVPVIEATPKPMPVLDANFVGPPYFPPTPPGAPAAPANPPIPAPTKEAEKPAAASGGLPSELRTTENPAPPKAAEPAPPKQPESAPATP